MSWRAVAATSALPEPMSAAVAVGWQQEPHPNHGRHW